MDMSESEQETSVYVEMQPVDHRESTDTSGTTSLICSKQKGGERKEGSPCNKREEWSAVERIPVEHLNLDFEECFREHKSTRTFVQLHTLLSLIYRHTKFVVYHIFVIGIGVWLTLLLAVINGVFAFFHVWMWGPLLKLLLMVLYAFIKPIYSALVKAVLYPVVETAGLLCRCKDRKTST